MKSHGETVLEAVSSSLRHMYKKAEFHKFLMQNYKQSKLFFATLVFFLILSHTVQSTTNVTTSTTVVTSLTVPPAQTGCNVQLTLYIPGNATCQGWTVKLWAVSAYFNASGANPAAFIVYYNSVMQSSSQLPLLLPPTTATYIAGNTRLRLNLSQTFAGQYLYQSWTKITLNVTQMPTTTTTTATTTTSTTTVAPTGYFPFIASAAPSSWGDVGIVIGGGSINVTQTNSNDCFFVANCTVSLLHPVSAGDMLIVLIPGSAILNNWHVSSINDKLGASFSSYKSLTWNYSQDYFGDYVYYGIVTSGGSYDSVTVNFNSGITRADPIVVDVKGSGLGVYGGSSGVCTYSCNANIGTLAVQLPSNSVSIASAYVDQGAHGVRAGNGWAQISTGAYYMAGEYNLSGTTSNAIPVASTISSTASTTVASSTSLTTTIQPPISSIQQTVANLVNQIATAIANLFKWL